MSSYNETALSLPKKNQMKIRLWCDHMMLPKYVKDIMMKCEIFLLDSDEISVGHVHTTFCFVRNCEVGTE